MENLRCTREQYPTLTGWDNYEYYTKGLKDVESRVQGVSSAIQSIKSKYPDVGVEDGVAVSLPNKVYPDTLTFLMMMEIIGTWCWQYIDSDRQKIVADLANLILFDRLRGSNLIEEISRTDSYPNWMYTSDKSCFDYFDNEIVQVMLRWNPEGQLGSLNYYCLFQPIIKAIKYGINELTALTFLQETHNNLIRSLESHKWLVSHLTDSLNRASDVQRMLNEGRSIYDLVKIRDFSFLDSESRDIMTKAYLVVCEQEVQNWLLKGDKIDYDSPTSHFVRDKISLEGSEFCWCMAQYRSIFSEGWIPWYYRTLLNKGVGYDHISFENILEYGTEESILYGLKKSQTCDSHKLALSSIDKDHPTVLKYVLDNDSTFSKSQIQSWATKCDANNKHELLRILLNIWEKRWPRKFTVRSDLFHDYVKVIWNLLPYNSFCLEKTTPPTDDDIDDYIKEGGMDLNGKYLFWLMPDKEFDPFHLDKKLGSFGIAKKKYLFETLALKIIN